MASSDDDENLKRAIAMSLGDADPSSASTVIDSDDSDEDDKLRQAIALSLQDSEKSRSARLASQSALKSAGSTNGYASPTPLKSNPPTQQSGRSSTMTTAMNPPSALLGLDRKAMEQERLARHGKRKRSASPEKPSKMTTNALSQESILRSEGSKPGRSTQQGIVYPRGTIKRTWAYMHPRTDDIKIEEVVQASTINIAVLSAFEWDDHWVFSKLNPKKTKQVWIMNAKGEDLQAEIRRQMVECDVPNLKLHFPPIDGNIQHMHSKLMLLFHPTHLRIVVPTSNMRKVHWGETNTDPKGEAWQAAVFENSVFVVDVPRRADGQVGRKADVTWFGQELLDFLEAQEVGANVTEGVLKFDFLETKGIAFVHSIPGKYGNRFPDRTGLPSLTTALRRLGLDNVEHLELDYAASALGALNEAFLEQLYKAAGGQTTSSRSNILDHVRIYYPTHDTVVNSTGGANCGGIITLQRHQYSRDAFPKQCMRDYKSTRPGVLSHNKLLVARGRRKDGSPVAWVYVGSANLSESAWGSHRILKSGKQGKPNIRNWESGVVVPVAEDALKGLKLDDGEVPPMSVFKDTLEIAFQYPGDKYEGRQPWFFTEHMD